jgi:hypothetical protein
LAGYWYPALTGYPVVGLAGYPAKTVSGASQVKILQESGSALDLDPHSSKILDPDLQTNADLKNCLALWNN